jgi:flagellar biosynthesis regulator FlaF
MQAGSTTTASLLADKQGVVTRTVCKLAEIKDREIEFVRRDLGNAQAEFENRVLQAVPHKVRVWINSLPNVPNVDNAIAAEEAAIVHNIVILATAEMQKRVLRARDFITCLQPPLREL